MPSTSLNGRARASPTVSRIIVATIAIGLSCASLASLDRHYERAGLIDQEHFVAAPRGR